VKDAEIASFAIRECEKIVAAAVGESYRCAAYLNDGLYLPCVLIASKRYWVQLALRRFDETRADASGFFRKRRFGTGFDYVSIVESFIAADNRVNTCDIAQLELSDFAIPLQRLVEVHGETSMSWTQFIGEMSDGLRFNFGTTFSTEFFNMPAGYSGRDITRIHSHQRGEGEFYRERPFFTCFVENL
jgi:hypothetical protein